MSRVNKGCMKGIESMIDLTSRKGEFSISKICLFENSNIIQEVFKRVIPVGIQYDYLREVFTYQALSKEFDVVEEVCMIPKYDVQINKDGKVEFVK